MLLDDVVWLKFGELVLVYVVVGGVGGWLV